MNRSELVARLRQLPFDPKDYWLITGGAMVFYGIREETGDIDLGCTRELADQLESQGFRTTVMSDGTRRIQMGNDVEIFEEWLYDKVELVEEIPVISIPGLIEMKRSIGREKDMRDIRLIEEFINNRKP